MTPAEPTHEPGSVPGDVAVPAARTRDVELGELTLTLLALALVGLLSVSFYLGVRVGQGSAGSLAAASSAVPSPPVATRTPPLARVAPPRAGGASGLPAGFQGPPRPAPGPADEGTATVSSAEGLRLEVASFPDIEAARERQRSLLSRGYPAYVRGPEKGTRGAYRVFVGDFTSEAEATDALGKLKAREGIDARLVR